MKHFDSAACPTCNTIHENAPVEHDAFGSYAIIEACPCADRECSQMLCGACDQFHCDGCGLTFCADHLVSVPDGTDRPLHCCNACAAECEPLELPLAIPPQTETRIAAVAGKAVA